MGLDLKKGWIAAKKKFEKAAGKKKPSASLTGIFSKPSGLQPAFGKLDKAIEALEKNNDSKKVDALKKAARDALEKVRNVETKYFFTLSDQIDEENQKPVSTDGKSSKQDGNYKGPLNALVNDSEDLCASAMKFIREFKFA